MGLFGNDSSFTSQTHPRSGPYSWTAPSLPAGWAQVHGDPTANGSYVQNLNTGQDVYNRDLINLLGTGRNSLGQVTGWQDPNSYSNQNFDLIANNMPTLQQGNNLPFEQQQFQRDFLNNPNTTRSDPTQYLMGGNPFYAQNSAATLGWQAAAAQGRAAPQVQTGAVNMINGGAGQSLGQSNATNLYTLNAAGQLNNAANGAGYQGQLSSAQGLQDLAGKIGTGPSAAEMAMRASNDQGLANQAALAAGARGGNSALALRNAAANAGTLNAQTTNAVGIQRANEVATNNAQKIQALSNANQGFGGAAGTQQGALGASGQLTSSVAANQLGQANTQAGIANTYADLAKAQGNLALGQTAQNDQMAIQSQQLADQYMQQQLQGTMAYDQNRTQNQANILTNQYANRDRSGEGTITGSGGGDKALGAGMQALGTLGALSDVRAKKNIKQAGEDVSNAIRGVDVPYPMAVGSFPDAPAYSYDYKNPAQVGAAPGTHYGPMAQDLEKTPAGASVVVDKGGKKAVDTGRLSLLNTAELSKMRKELDAINAQAGAIRGTYVPTPLGGASDMHLNPSLAPAVPAGAARPFAPGEYVSNPDGSWSSERSMTVQAPRFNGGKATNIPSIWIKGGRPYEARDEDEAIRLAQASGLGWQAYPSLRAADQASIDREAAWQPLQRPEDASSIAPLYTQPRAAIPDLSAAMSQASQVRAPQVPYPQPQPYRLGGV